MVWVLFNKFYTITDFFATLVIFHCVLGSFFGLSGMYIKLTCAKVIG